jgi:hypothetical protein
MAPLRINDPVICTQESKRSGILKNIRVVPRDPTDLQSSLVVKLYDILWKNETQINTRNRNEFRRDYSGIFETQYNTLAQPKYRTKTDPSSTTIDHVYEGKGINYYKLNKEKLAAEQDQALKLALEEDAQLEKALEDQKVVDPSVYKPQDYSKVIFVHYYQGEHKIVSDYSTGPSFVVVD